MEEDDVLHSMAKFDFNSSTNVTNIIFDDSNDEDNISEPEHTSDKKRETSYENNDTSIFSNKTIGQNPEVSELQKYLETPTPKKNMDNTNLKRKINTTQNSPKVAKDQKGHEHAVFKQIKNTSHDLFFKDVNEEKSYKTNVSENRNSFGVVEAMKLNNENFEVFWATMKKSLMNISTHIIIIIKSLNKFNKIKKTLDYSEIEIENAESSYKIMKKLCFKLIYCTTISILVPQEHNKEFMKDVINTTVKIANMSKKTYTSFEQIQLLFQELIEWAKQQKNRSPDSKDLKVELSNWAEIKKNIQIQQLSPSDLPVIQKTNQLSSELMEKTQMSIEMTETLKDTTVKSFNHTENATNDKNIIITSNRNSEPSCSKISNNNQVQDINQEVYPMQKTPEPIVNSCFFPLPSNKNSTQQNIKHTNVKEQITTALNVEVNPMLQIQSLQNIYPNVNSNLPREFLNLYPAQQTRPQYYRENHNQYPHDRSNNIINNVHTNVFPDQQYNFIQNSSSNTDKQPLVTSCTLMDLQNCINDLTPHPSTKVDQRISYRYNNIITCGCILGRNWRQLRQQMAIARKNYTAYNNFNKQITPFTSLPILHNTQPQPPPYPGRPTQFIDDQNRNNNYQIILKVQNVNELQKGQHYGSIEIHNQNNAVDTTRSTTSRDSGIASPTCTLPTSTHNNIIYEDNGSPSISITHINSLNSNVVPICEGKCYRCGKVCNLKCIGCYKVYYCSHDCQKLDWKDHRINCEGGTKR